MSLVKIINVNGTSCEVADSKAREALLEISSKIDDLQSQIEQLNIKVNNYHSGTSIEDYNITTSLTNCTINNSAKTVKKGSSYKAVITPNASYTLNSVTCTMGGATQTVTNGQINIPSVTGNIVITATATSTSTGETSYNVTYNLQSCTSDNTAATVANGSSYTATITAQAWSYT